MMNRFGFVRVSCVSPRVVVGDAGANGAEAAGLLGGLRDSDVVVFPELGLTGYTCADLFGQTALLEGAEQAALRVAEATRGGEQVVVVGLPLAVGNRLYNCALVVGGGEMLGVAPKQFLPNYKEFYEGRWFAGATGEEPREVVIGGKVVPFGVDLLFDAGDGVVVGVEICEDLWMPIPPSSSQALGGATVLVNLSASNETVGKARYRRELVVGQSGRCVAAYAYAGAGASESSTDLVFGGHCLIAENGRLLEESPRVGDGGSLPLGSHAITRDVDVGRLLSERRSATSFGENARRAGVFRRIPVKLAREMEGLKREVAGTPFVPSAGGELHERCAEVFGIQCAGLAKRIEGLPAGTPLNIGISGGLDSTLALLVAVKTLDALGEPRSRIQGLTMPGFGTTGKTRTNALDLMGHLGVGSETIGIGGLALEAFRELGHRPFGIDCAVMGMAEFVEAIGKVPKEERHDLVFENVQARLRTFLLMSRGFVIGTGDLSELALGWCTYNGDHMSMYNPNCSIPKTLASFLVRYVAENEFPEGAVRETLLSIAGTTISPELLPAGAEGEIEQSTEDTLGPYELHDFALYNTVRLGYSPEKVLFLSGYASFTRVYPRELISRTFATFYRRFFANQFKRSCVPDGPKVGTVSLSPRGDWRMPSDASAREWLRSLEGGGF